MDVSDAVFVVTGGGNGIGRHVVLELLSRGAKVMAVDIRQDSLDETAALAGVGDALATVVVDITDRTAVSELPGRTVAALGAVDGVVNVAGIIQPFVPLADLDYPSIERVVNVNLWGTIHVVKAFLPFLVDRPVAHIVVVSSMGGYVPVPGQTVYGATKAAVKLIGEGLYSELLETNVGVSVVMPGAVGTDIGANSGVPTPGGAAAEEAAAKFPTTSPEDAAVTIVDGIEGDRLHVFVGRDAKLMSRLTRLAPRRATHFIRRQMADLLEF